MEPGQFIGLVAVLGCFGLPALSMWTSHRRKVLEMKLRTSSQVDEGLRTTVDQLRAEVRSLRDTTTQYDMSFDTALQRIERRVDSLENHAITARAEPVRTVEIQSGR